MNSDLSKNLRQIMKKISIITILSFLCLSIFLPSFAEEAQHYKTAVGDTLNIQVYQEPDLSGDYEIKEDGTITYPLIGSIKVINITKSDVEKKITQLLEKDYLVKPYLRVSIRTYHERNIMILGCVKKPGTYPFPENRNPTLLEIITLAGGFTGYAAVNGTKIIRTSDDGKKIVIDSRVNDIINGRRKDIILEKSDLVFVPERIF